MYILDHKNRFRLAANYRNLLCQRAVIGLIRSAHRKFHLRRVAGNPGLHLYLSGISLDLRGHLDAGASVIVQGKVPCRDTDQFYRAVNAAIEGKIRLLGIDDLIVAVVRRHCQHILIRQSLCDVHSERGVASLVMGQLLIVQVDVRRHGDPLKFYVNSLPCGNLRPGKLLRVPAGAPVVIVSSVLSVLRVPCVGQGYRLPGQRSGSTRVLAAEKPVRAEIQYLSHTFSS